jgi:hypothetical protein
LSFLYTVTDDAVAVTGAIDVVEVTVAAETPVLVHLLSVLQTTDLGDAAEEVIRIGFLRGVTAGSGGTAATENGNTNGAPTATAAATTFRTTASTGGTRIRSHGWNIRIPLQIEYVPEWRPKVDAGEDPYSYRLLAAPTDSITCGMEHGWEEVA